MSADHDACMMFAFGKGISGLPSFRLSLLLSLSGEVVLFSLFPLLLSFKLSEPNVWIVAALVYGSVHLAQMAHSVIGYQEEKAGDRTPNLDQGLMTIGAILSVALIAAGLLGSASDVQMAYASLLTFALLVAGTQFYRLLMLVHQVSAR